MPKATYGTRPITILPVSVRVIYEALVTLLEPSLPEDSRAKPHTEHRNFGATGQVDDSQRFVDIDIAACYEYIDHELLCEELILQGADPSQAWGLRSVLGSIFPGGIGLPQATYASHRLADAYLARLQRAILRSGRRVHRYADDFRIVCGDWADAHAAIELAAEEARQIGLTLSDGKTTIRSADQILAHEQVALDLFEEHKSKASDSLRQVEFVQVGYDDFDIAFVDADEVAVEEEALRNIVKIWASHDREKDTVHPRLATRALVVLAQAPNRLEDELLLEIIERAPLHLPSIARYIEGRRAEEQENWSTLSELIQSERFGTWSKLWMLAMSRELTPTGSNQEEAFLQWCERRLSEPHETIRAEAAWVLGLHNRLRVDDIGRLYANASDVSRTALAAAAGRIDSSKSSPTSQAIHDDSSLARAAFLWGAKQS